jgi:hypothetical protein
VIYSVLLQKRLTSFSAQPSLWSDTECTRPWALTHKAVEREGERRDSSGDFSLEEQEQLDEDEGEVDAIEEEIFDYQENVLPYAKKEYAEKKKAFEELWKLKDRGEYEVRNHIENEIIQKYKMRTQAHHGGDKYTGVDIGILMGNAGPIVGEIEAYLLEIKHPLKAAKDGETIIFCDHIKRLLNILDGMFSILRMTHGEFRDAHLTIYESSAKEAVLFWKKLGLSYTPSFHYLHKEALRLLRLHGGIGELLEDHLEQSHQKMDRIHQRLARLGFGEKRAMAISRLAEMDSHPIIKDVREKVMTARKRNFTQTSKGEKELARKRMKDEFRAKNLECELETVKDETIVTGHEAAKRTV